MKAVSLLVLALYLAPSPQARQRGADRRPPQRKITMPAQREGTARPAPVPAPKRVALVIGNGAYKVSPLRNPVNDARAMRDVLGSLGFEVIYRENAGAEAMKRAVRELGAKIREGGVSLFYYAGHGVQINGVNYLIPVDAHIEGEADIEDQGVNANFVLRQMDSDREDSTNIVILDACRNNPFARSYRSPADGLARIDAPNGTIIAYATAPGSVASDGGDAANGVYTQELLKFMRMPGVSVEEIFKGVRAAVRQKTQNKQNPWMESSFSGQFYFVDYDNAAGGSAAAQSGATPPGPAVIGGHSNLHPGQQFYNTARQLEATKEFSGAASLYREAIKLEPNKALYHHALGKALFDDWRQKYQAWSEGEKRAQQQEKLRTELNPQTPSVPMWRLATLTGPSPDLPQDEVVSAFRQAAKLEPGNAEYRKDFVNAITSKLSSSISSLWISSNLGIRSSFRSPFQNKESDQDKEAEKIILQGYKTAESEIREILQLEPDDSELHELLAKALKGQGRLAETEAAYKEALRLNPQNLSAHSDFAELLAAQSRWAEAEAEYREAVRLYPAGGTYHSLLADALRAQGKLEAALEEYEEALRLAPKEEGPSSNFDTLPFSLKNSLQAKITELRKQLKKSRR